MATLDTKSLHRKKKKKSCHSQSVLTHPDALTKPCDPKGEKWSQCKQKFYMYWNNEDCGSNDQSNDTKDYEKKKKKKKKRVSTHTPFQSAARLLCACYGHHDFRGPFLPHPEFFQLPHTSHDSCAAPTIKRHWATLMW